MNIETIRREALSLTAHERAELAGQLLSSLDALSPTEIEPFWFQEAARRAAEMDQGGSQRIAALKMPVSGTARLIARCTRSSYKWCRRSTPLRGSIDSVGEGNNQNHPQV